MLSQSAPYLITNLHILGGDILHVYIYIFIFTHILCVYKYTHTHPVYMHNNTGILWSVMQITEKATAPHSSALPWKLPWTEEPGRLQSMGSQRVRHDWAISLSLFTLMHWRRKWQPTPVFLPGESQGLEPGGLPSMGSHRVGHDWRDLAIQISGVWQVNFNHLSSLKSLSDCSHNSKYSPSSSTSFSSSRANNPLSRRRKATIRVWKSWRCPCYQNPRA